MVSAECLRLGLADEVRYSILPILIGDGIPFFEKLDRDIALHLAEVKAYKSGMVELRYEVRGSGGGQAVRQAGGRLVWDLHCRVWWRYGIQPDAHDRMHWPPPCAGAAIVGSNLTSSLGP